MYQNIKGKFYKAVDKSPNQKKKILLYLVISIAEIISGAQIMENLGSGDKKSNYI